MQNDTPFPKLPQHARITTSPLLPITCSVLQTNQHAGRTSDDALVLNRHRIQPININSTKPSVCPRPTVFRRKVGCVVLTAKDSLEVVVHEHLVLHVG